MRFMSAQMTEKQHWIMADGDSGTEAIPADLVDMPELKRVMRKDDLDSVLSLIRDYIESRRLFSVEILYGYGVRSSASGYMDCTSWAVYTNKREAEQAARQEQRECDGKE